MEDEALFTHTPPDRLWLTDVNKLLMFQEKIAFLQLSGELNDGSSIFTHKHTDG